MEYIVCSNTVFREKMKIYCKRCNSAYPEPLTSWSKPTLIIRGSGANGTHGEAERTSFIQPLQRNDGALFFLPVATIWDSTEKTKPDLFQQCTMQVQQDEYKLEDGKFQLDIERNFLLRERWSNTGMRGERGNISILGDSMQP